MTMSILKDRAFAYYFGSNMKGKVGVASMGLWLIRDVLTMAGAFILPAKLSAMF